ncbi:MAG TPA: hypothetical protein VMX17_15465, partial [Candidatus Glassbacteria bacterium]|nr:hypothetical protein [Candidatus Glassbacteria bacterium]
RIKTNKGQSGKIKVTVTYNPIYIKKLKYVTSHSWNPEQKCWVFPHSDRVVYTTPCHLYRQIGSIYDAMSDINKLSAINKEK